MKISIIVPTRNGSDYLPSCLETCLAPEDKDLEVIVSDNNAGSETRDAVAKINDSRLRLFSTGGNLSMRQNYEFALSKATGDYIIMIGDDDGILKNGLATLRLLIDKHQPDVINWRILRYIWPHTRPEPTEGIVNFRRRDFFGPMKQINPQEVLAKFCSAETVKYKEGANLYHGCVARHVIENLKKKTGEYFQAANPDMYASMANLTEAKSMLWIKNPVTIGGESEKSIGNAAAKKQAPTATEAETAANWGVLAQADTVKPEVDPGIRQIIPFTYAILNRMNRLVADNRLPIDHAAWRNAVRKDMEGLPADELAKNDIILQKLFAELDPKYQSGSFKIAETAAEPGAADTDDVEKKTKKKRRRKISRQHAKTVASVASWIDIATGSPYRPKINPGAATAFQLWKMIGMEINLKKIKG